MGLDKGIAYEDTVFVRDKDLLFGKYHTADTVSGPRNALAVKFPDVFMSVRAQHTAAVAVDAEIERRAVLDDSFVKR